MQKMYAKPQWIEGVKKVHDYLKANDLLAVPFDKICRLCVMKKSTYSEKLDDVLNSDQFQKINGAKDEIVTKNEKRDQFQKINGAKDEIVIKNEKHIIDSLQQLRKQKKISDKIYRRLRSTGSQPARLYGLAKVHKKDTHLRPVL